MYRYNILSLAFISILHAASASGNAPQRPFYQRIVDALAIPYEGNHIPLSTVYRYITNYFSDHSFDAVMVPNAHDVEPRIILNNNAIIHITDACKTPIYISRMPRSCNELAQLRADAWLAPDALIEIYTLNTRDEQSVLELAATLAMDGHTVQYQYSTIDFTPPTVVDLIRGIQMLRTRDCRAAQLACVHCKAGIGRSTTLVAAYLIYLYLKTDKKIDMHGMPIYEELDATILIERIITYLQSKRPIVYLNTVQRNGLRLFYEELIAAGSFENLHAQYNNEINARDIELTQNFSTVL